MSERRDEFLDLLGALVAARTVNPPGNEAAAAAVVRRFFDDAGIASRTFEKEPGRTNIIGTIGSGAPVLAVACHLDTVPAGEGWSSDPFRLRVEGDKAYGRGANDNKGPLAAALLAGRRLMESGVGGTLLVAGLADEERGNEFGARYLLNEVGLKADFAIAPDSAGHMEEIDLGEKGCVFVTVKCTGRAAHASRPGEGVNAVAAMAAFLAEISRREAPSPPHPHFSPATMNIGTVAGGTAPNVVPDSCTAMIDFRVLPGTSAADIVRFLEDGVESVRAAHPEAGWEIQVGLSMAPHEVDREGPLAAACLEASRRVYGREMRALYQGGITIAKEFVLAGVPAVGMGPGAFEAAHAADEWIEIDEALSFADFLVEVARVLLD